MIKKETIVFGKQCLPVGPRLKSVRRKHKMYQNVICIFKMLNVGKFICVETTVCDEKRNAKEFQSIQQLNNEYQDNDAKNTH